MINKLDKFFLGIGIYQALKNLLDHWAFKLSIGLLGGFNAYIMFVLGNEGHAKVFKQNFKFIADFVLENAGFIVVATVFIATSYGLLYSFLVKKCDNIEEKYEDLKKQYDIALVVLGKIEAVVVAKRMRFALFANRYANIPASQKPRLKVIFEGITQPEVQIQLLIESLRDCLNSIYPNETIKVALMRVTDSKIDDWVCHSPYDTKPRTSINVLKNPNSTFSKCIEKNKIIIVPDTQIEIQKQFPADIMFIQGLTDPSEKWCQVCAPIHSINSNDIIYIISIAIKRENVIVQENLSYLEWLLKFFKSRLALEHSLDQLKKKVS